MGFSFSKQNFVLATHPTHPLKFHLVSAPLFSPKKNFFGAFFRMKIYCWQQHKLDLPPLLPPLSTRTLSISETREQQFLHPPLLLLSSSPHFTTLHVITLFGELKQVDLRSNIPYEYLCREKKLPTGSFFFCKNHTKPIFPPNPNSVCV